MAMRNLKFATGNRVYGGVSHSPHSGGGLDKTGYKDRDRKAKVKRNLLLKQLKGKKKW